MSSNGEPTREGGDKLSITDELQRKPRPQWGERGGRDGGIKSDPGPIAPPPGAKPTPEALATAPTPLKNDPMWIDFEDHGFSGLTPYRGEIQLADTFDGFLPLFDCENDLSGSADKNFTKFISRWMWNYYCMEQQRRTRARPPIERNVSRIHSDQRTAQCCPVLKST
jgi:hypothetical protein